MKAIVYTKYGPPEVLQLKEVAKPVPKDNQVLVKVHAASANALDWHFMRGAPFLARLAGGLRKPKDPRLGADFAGRVDTFEEAAAIPVAAIPALHGLRDKGQIQSRQKVLVNGASGGVGTFAVQIAKSFGTEVTGVCSTRNLDLVRSIGADHVIDYTQADFTKNGQHYDLIYDAVGNRSVSDYKRALNPNGTCVIAGFQNLPRLFEHMVLGPLRSRTGNKKVGLMGIAKMNQKDLVFVKELLEAGKIVPVIERRYPLREVPEAIRYLEEGHARGKVVITIEQNNKTSL